jgi:hypothetical protein
MADRVNHPSGRPIHKEVRKGRQIWRIPEDGYVTPRLRQGHAKDAIGFCATHLPGQQKLDDE